MFNIPWLRYLRSKYKFERKFGLKVPMNRAMSEYKDWKKFRDRESSPLADRIPWITFGATNFLRENIKKGMTAFEWGLGGSTAFLLDSGVQVTSVEHDKEWFGTALEALGNRESWKPLMIEPKPSEDSMDPTLWSDYGSSAAMYKGMTFKEYVQSIDSHADESFDLILVDGRCRPSCFHHALPKIAKNGFILWDNTERPSYQKEMQELDTRKFKMYDFPGASPFASWFTRTVIWQRQD